MKNYVLLHEDKSCGLLFSLLHRDKSKFYPYPVVYEDGLISRFKSASSGRKVWGFCCKGYIISINPAPEEMSPREAKEYCQNNIFAGQKYRLVPRAVMRNIFNNSLIINELLENLGGTPFEAKWYMAANDRYTTDISGRTIDPNITCGVSPRMSEGKGFFYIPEDSKAAFYPAVKCQL